jgi:hypothetical protein
MAAPWLGVMRVKCVVARLSAQRIHREIQFAKVAKVILDNHCFEWRMDGGNSEIL